LDPLYHRIQRDMIESISSGEYSKGDRMPSEAVAERYGVTRMTVRRAMDGLVNQGLVTRRQGSGTYVLGEREARRALNKLTGFTEDMRANGQRSTCAELDRRSVVPPDYVREQLQLEEGAHTVFLERLRRLGDTAVAIQHVWLPLALAPDLARRSLDGGSLYDTLERDLGIRLASARQRITAGSATERQAGLLGVQVGEPLLFTQRLTRDNKNHSVEFAESWMSPTLPLWVELQR